MLKRIIASFCAGLIVILAAIGVSAESLRTGAEGTEVLRLQMNLNGLGYAKLVTDGVYGSATESAVYVFQSVNGLAVDGIAGDKTQAEIKSIVRGVQSALASHGYNPGAADGVYGEATKAAVKKFQAANGLVSDGIAGYRTIAKLGTSSNKTNNNGSGYANTKSNVRTYSLSKDANKTVSGIKVSKFACKDGSDTVLIDDKLAALIQEISNHYGKEVKITSGYRTPSYNTKVGGAKNSYHVKGMAADISVTGVSQRELARYAESLGVKGIGLYNSFVHVDTRTTKYYWSNGSQVATFY